MVSPSDWLRRETITSDRSSAQKHVWRCRIVLLSAKGAGTAAIMRETDVSRTAGWRWQEQFVQQALGPQAHPQARRLRLGLRPAIRHQPIRPRA
jgi:Homeodomain-like domain